MSLQAYQKTQKAFSNPRDIEYRLFAQITAALIDTQDLARTDQRLINALARNRELWTTLAADCSSDENRHAAALRAQIVSLSLWVNRFTSEVMRRKVPVVPLININRTIMEGLALKSQAAVDERAQGRAPHSA
jgi:flagellar protein FlaF